MTHPTTRARREGGMVLLMVLFFALLLFAFTATFLRRATVDASISRNRDAALLAESLARGGVRLAEALLAEDRRLELVQGLPVETLYDPWARTAAAELTLASGATLRLRIEDAGARLNLNALPLDASGAASRAELFLTEVLRKVIDEMPGRPEEKLYDPVELARNLIDWIDADDVRVGGGDEDEPYLRLAPPYRTPDRPLLSVDELRLVDGFDGPLVEALRPYVGVFPLADGSGINPNTAPPWVLALLFHGVAGELRLADEDLVADLLEARRDGVICPETLQHERCIPIHEATHEIDAGDEIYPPIGVSANVFRVIAEARVDDVQRRVEAVLDRRRPSAPVRLAWQAR